MNPHDDLGARLDEHALQKMDEAKRFGKQQGGALCSIATTAISDLARINATREQVQFVQDWINEVAEMVRPVRKPIIEP